MKKLAIQFSLISSLLFVAQQSLGAQRVISIDEAPCVYRVQFDPAKYDEGQIRSTVDAVLAGHVTDFLIPSYPFTPEGVAALDIAKYHAQCTKTIEYYLGRKLIDLPGIETYRDTAIEQMRDSCAYGEALIRGFHGDYAGLRQYTPAASCSRFVDALEWKTDLASVWQQRIEDSCRNAVDVKACSDKLRIEASGPNGAEWIRFHVINFDWANCAVKSLKINTVNIESMRAALEAKFKSSFKVKEQCEKGTD